MHNFFQRISLAPVKTIKLEIGTKNKLIRCQFLDLFKNLVQPLAETSRKSIEYAAISNIC